MLRNGAAGLLRLREHKSKHPVECRLDTQENRRIRYERIHLEPHGYYYPKQENFQRVSGV